MPDEHLWYLFVFNILNVIHSHIIIIDIYTLFIAYCSENWKWSYFRIIIGVGWKYKCSGIGGNWFGGFGLKETPLHTAFKCSKFNIAEKLIKSETDKNCINIYGESPE